MPSRNETHWSAFLASVERLNAFKKPGVLRRYQQDILELGRFEVVSPYSGAPSPLLCSNLIGSTIAYRFFDREHFAITTGQTQFGWPLSDFFPGRDAGARHIFPFTPALGRNRREVIRENLASAPMTTKVTRALPILIVGHPNFAHHLWNELSALDEWLEIASDDAVASLKIISTAEPLGPLPSIFPRLRNASFISDAEMSRGEERSAVPIFVRIGSRIVTERVRKNICNYSERQANKAVTEPVLRIMNGGSPRIWISVRQKTRTADNQMEFIAVVLHRIFRAYPKATIVFDGFSYPVGFFDDTRMRPFHDSFVDRAKEAAEFIAALRSRVVSELGEQIGARLCSISGLSLGDAIHIGSCCDYYICHVGTLQHKIGWLHNIPGFVHSPPHGITHGRWHANQVEGGAVPDILPPKLAVSILDAANKRKVSRNANYRIVDVERAADLVIQSMRSRLATRVAI